MADITDEFDLEGISVNESEFGECEAFWLAKGPPFDQRDYMISPSETTVASTVEKPPEKRKLRPSDIKIDEKYLFDSAKALRKLVDLVKDGFAHTFLGRLEELLRIFLGGCSSGFFVDDLPGVIEVVEYFSRNKDLVPEYSDFVKIIMCSAKEPPKLKRASDILYCKDTLADYFTLFGELLATFEEESFQIQILKAVDSLLFKRELLDTNCVKLSACHEAVEESHLPFAMAFLMETVPPNLYFRYQAVALNIILISPKAAYKMMEGNVLEHVIWRMRPDDPKDPPPEVLAGEVESREYYQTINVSSSILWALFSIVSKYNLKIPVPTEKALWSLKYLFQREERKTGQKAIKTRNNAVAILVKLVSIFGEELPLARTKWLKDIPALAVATELKPKTGWVAEIKLGVTEEDYLLKQFLLLCCCLLAKGKDFLEAFESCDALEGLLRLVKPQAKARWISTQATNLFIVSFRILSEIVPKIPQSYVSKKGNARLLNALKRLTAENLEEESLLEALKTFSAILSCGETKILEDAKKRGGIATLLELGFRLLDVTYMKLDHQEKLARVFLSLERLLINDVNLRNTHGKSCVSLSIRLLQRITANSENDSKWNPVLLLSFGGFFWEAVAWCRSALASFIELGGVFLLLDFIEVSNFPLQMLFLGALVDMTDEGETIAHLLTWRGKSGCGVLSLMIDIWRKEEYFTKVHRTKEGFIKDLDAPLMTEEQWYLTHQFPKGHFSSPSIAEMMCSARPKVHALYQFLTRRYFDLTQIGESAYPLHFTAIKPSQSVYIPLLEHYLPLKMGEVWHEIIREVNITGTLPLIFDGETMCTLIDEKNKWAFRIRTVQEEIALLRSSQHLDDEKEYYRFLKFGRLADALEALDSLDYITRTSFREFQRKRKEKQAAEVEKSLRHYSCLNETNFHRTFFLNSNFTHVKYDTFLVVEEGESTEREVPAPVSPDRSEESRF